MDVTSTYRFARISPYKAREVTREIQGLPVSDALDILTFTPRKAAFLIGKTMKAAMADAENNFELSLESLVVKEATVGEGPAFKRWKPRARGSAAPIRKRTSHIRIVLSDETPDAGETKSKAETPATGEKSAPEKEKQEKAAKSEKEAAPKESAAKKEPAKGKEESE